MGIINLHQEDQLIEIQALLTIETQTLEGHQALLTIEEVLIPEIIQHLIGLAQECLVDLQ